MKSLATVLLAFMVKFFVVALGRRSVAVSAIAFAASIWSVPALTVTLLVPQGTGRRRRITVADDKAAHPLRVAILDYEPIALTEGYIFECQRLLEEAGIRPFYAPKSLMELGMDARRVARLVAKTEADAWIVCSGSREVLEWFAAQPVPTFALFGGREGLPLAGVGPDKLPALRAATRALIALDHRRIVVLLARRDWHAGRPDRYELGFFDELAAHGIAPGPFNLPEWDDSREGFHQQLDELYRLTPPTALILDQASLFAAAQQHLAQRGLLVPQHVSLVCTDPDPTFAWCQPTIAHIRWDSRPVVRRIVRWAANVSRGKDDRRQSFTQAEFVPGGTIGPVKG